MATTSSSSSSCIGQHAVLAREVRRDERGGVRVDLVAAEVDEGEAHLLGDRLRDLGSR